MRRINFFPYRDQARKIRLNRFFLALAGASILAIACSYFVHAWFVQADEAQEQRNAFLRKELQLLDAQIGQGLKAKQDEQRITARKNQIDIWLAQKGDVAQILNDLAKQTPAGVQLLSIRSEGAQILLTGAAISHDRVTEFMRRLSAGNAVKPVHLNEIVEANTKSNAGKVPAFQFSMHLEQQRKP